MNLQLEELQKLPVFRNISKEGMQTMMDCFSAELIVLNQGDTLVGNKRLAVCPLSGRIEGLTTGSFFPMPQKGAEKAAIEDSVVLVMDSHMLLYPCYGCCIFHVQLLQNMREDGIDVQALNH